MTTRRTQPSGRGSVGRHDFVARYIETALQRDPDGVWVPAEGQQLTYSDGDAERYLDRVLREARDLGSRSPELAARIRDWPSEYHLSPERAHLLRGFIHRSSQTVLEVGSGCGAITRFLGETYDHVLAVEGSQTRARLGRLRTRDQPNVEIVASPLEELRFRVPFELVFCIGVLEYASMFGEGEDPHTAMLDRLADLVAPGGALVVAIENKLGLKYFGASAEDHTGVMFDGIEGYPRFEHKARTFGRVELAERLARHFGAVDFYYPWPDYKTPACVTDERMISLANPAGLIGSFRSVDHGRRRRPLFDESLVWHELAANGLIPALANSFLVVATKGSSGALRFDGLAQIYSRGRRPVFETVTRIGVDADGSPNVTKSRVAGDDEYVEGRLRHRKWSGPWLHGPSLHAIIARRVRSREVDLATMLAPSRPWIEDLRASAGPDGTVPGACLDAVWTNCWVTNGTCRYIDEEWEWTERLPLRLVVARALLFFSSGLVDTPSLSPTIRHWRVDKFVVAAAATYGIAIDAAALRELARFEGAFVGQIAAGSFGEPNVERMLRRHLDPSWPQRLRALPRQGLESAVYRWRR